MTDPITPTAAAEAPRKRGRPRKLPEIRDSAASPQLARGGRAQAMGREGKIVSRRNSGTTDKFDLRALGIQPPSGWTYEWKRKTILGQEDTDHLAGLQENGWTSVPAERHASNYNFRTKTGEIVRDGMILMERPEELTREAREEERALARDQLRAQQAQYGAKMPSGMSVDNPRLGNRVRTSYETAPDAARPGYQYQPTDR